MAQQRLSAHERLSTGALARLARSFAYHPWRTILGWVAIIIALFVLVATIGGSLRDEFEIPGSDTQKATDLIEQEFASEQGGVLNVVFAAPEGERLDTPERQAAIEAAVNEARTKFAAPAGQAEPENGHPALVSIDDPFSQTRFSQDGRIAYAEAQFDQTIEDTDRDGVVEVEEFFRQAGEAVGVQVEFNGEAEFPPIEQGTSELLGLLAAIIVLLIVFRTFVAMIIPIALAIVALMTAFLLLFILAGLMDINTITPILVSMIGLGVGIDYSLFIVTRFRQLLHDGLEPRDAAAEAGASAGRAVIFAGLTVAISVTGLAFIGLDFVTKLGIGSALGVLTTVLIANSLLLAVLAKLGHKVDRLKVPFLKPLDDSEEGRNKTLVARWGRFVVRRRQDRLPRRAADHPGRRLDVRAGAPRRSRPGHAARRADQPAGLRPARRGLRRRLQRPDPDRDRRQRRSPGSAADLRRPAGRRGRGGGRRAAVQRGQLRRDHLRHAGVGAAGRGDRQPRRSHTRHVVPGAIAGGDAQAYVSGQTAAFKDIADQILERMPYFLLYILGVTFIVLAMAFRSIVVSLTAAITTILSAFVGFGVLTLVVQEGHLLGLTGLDKTGPIETFVPPIAFAILFGLSMDYMVFIMSRIREEHVHGLKTADAVEHGIAAIGRVVVAAAIIMATVFAAFILSADRIPKEFGLLLAVAILTDALIVRMTLVPSLLTLLGEKSWYIPRWMDRALPNVTIEPPHEGDGREAPEERPLETAGRH